MYKGNYNVFDTIDTEEKAYWLGFIYADGYVCIRDRKGNGVLTYEIKLSLNSDDIDHLNKFKEFAQLENSVKIYFSKSSFKSADNKPEARIMIYNKHMGEILCNKYGIVPHRNSLSKILQHLPKELERHFIRGIFDADGSVSFYTHIKKNGHEYKKTNFSFTTQIETLNFISRHLFENGIADSQNHKYYQRHKDRDADCRTLTYSGINQVPRICKYLYNDAVIYLERKREKMVF